MTEKTLLIPLMAALLMVTGACSSIDCPVQNTVKMMYVLKKADAKPDTLKDTLNILSRRADGTDTLLLNRGVDQTQFSLNTGYANPEDTLIMLFSNGTYKATDTVWVKKENIPHFESVDCSPHFFHTITAVRSTHNRIDSIGINNRSVTYDPTTEHFYLYLHARN